MEGNLDSDGNVPCSSLRCLLLIESVINLLLTGVNIAEEAEGSPGGLLGKDAEPLRRISGRH